MSKQRKALICTMVVTLILCVLGLMFILLNRSQNIISPELAKAQTYERVKEGDDKTGSDFVKFDAFFLQNVEGDEDAEKIRGACKEIGEKPILYMQLNVLTNGKLEDGVIKIEGSNFNFETAIPEDNEVLHNAIGSNERTIYLKTIGTGTQKTLTGMVSANLDKDTDNYSAINKVTLTGVHVEDETGKRTEIKKEVNFTVDWYGTPVARINSVNQYKENTGITDEENGTLNLEFQVSTSEIGKQLLLKSAHLEGTLPEIGGIAPTGIEVKGIKDFKYDDKSRKFEITKETVLDENNVITSNCYTESYSDVKTNTYTIKAIYPIEAYQSIGADTVEIKIPVKAYYEGYNNPDTDHFDNPIKSNEVEETLIINYDNPHGDVAIFNLKVNNGVEISKGKPYNIYHGISAEETDDTYTVTWYLETGSEGDDQKIVIRETNDQNKVVSDEFIKQSSDAVSMQDLTTNIGIYFSNPTGLLGDDGYINVYNEETGELLHKFTKDDWSDYSMNTPYKYDLPVKHIKIETSNTKANSSLVAYNVKVLDDDYITTNYTEEQFAEFSYIKSTATAYFEEEKINTSINQTKYRAPYAKADLRLGQGTISTVVTTNMNIYIDAIGMEYKNQVKWKNGIFLLKLPKEIIDIHIDSVTTNNDDVSIKLYEQYKEDENTFIKIITENEERANYSININCSVTPNPTMVSNIKEIQLYSYNEGTYDYENNSQDIYDINGNLNKEEKINLSTNSLNLVAPSSLLTAQRATNYDTKGSVTTAPQIADVTKTPNKATINIDVNSNYDRTISNVKILGRVPYAGNKYVINGSSMGSTYTVTMSDKGIILPDALKSVATVYYSTNGEATEDPTNDANNWEKQPKNFADVKSFLIDLGNYALSKGEKHTISYEVNIPEGIEYNEVTYSHHAVYFKLDTAEGKYEDKTEPNKLGLRVTKKYNLEIVKYQQSSNKEIPGVTFGIYEKDQKEGKTKITGENGILTLDDLYVNKTYVIKEISAPEDYKINEEEIEFTLTGSPREGLKLNKIKGEVKNIQLIEPEGDENYKVRVEINNEEQARLKIVKKEENTNNYIPNVKFRLYLSSMPASERIITTDGNGEATIASIRLGEKYTLEEVKADGYYIDNPIEFKVNKQEEGYAIEIEDYPQLKNSNITVDNGIPIVEFSIENRKILTYNLEITKVAEITEALTGSSEETYLNGAKFQLYRGDKIIGSYTTQNGGKILIENLCQYVEGENLDAKYTLKEIVSPTGYAKIDDIVFSAQEVEGQLVLNTEGDVNYTVEGDTIKLTVKDEPSFKLVKKDADTKEPIPNVKFAIYNIDNGVEPAKDSEGNYLGTLETINGKEYYVLTTNVNGEIVVDLEKGSYKAVEIEAPKQYNNNNNNEYYFDVLSHNQKKLQAEWVKNTSVYFGNDTSYIIPTNDSGMIIGTTGRQVEKLSKDGITQWILPAKAIIQTSDGGYLALLNNSLVKYNSTLATEWGKTSSSGRTNCRTKRRRIHCI